MAYGGHEHATDLSDLMDNSRTTSYRLSGEIDKLETELQRFRMGLSTHSTPKADSVDSGIFSKRYSSSSSGYSNAAGTSSHKKGKPKVRFSEELTDEQWLDHSSGRGLIGSGQKKAVLDPGVTIRRRKVKQLDDADIRTESTSEDKSRVDTASSKTDDSTIKANDKLQNDKGIEKELPLKFTSSGRPSNAIKPATYDGTGSWIDYISHFKACATLNRWREDEKGLYLAVSLRGHAQGVLGNLTDEEGQHNFSKLVRALEERFAPKNQAELYRAQLKERRQKASETLPMLGQDIRRMTNLAYPTAPTDVREMLAMGQFIDALQDSEMRIRIKQARPDSLNDALRHAVELEAFNKAELKHETGQGRLRMTNAEQKSDEKGLQERIKILEEELRKLKSQEKPKTARSANYRNQGQIGCNRPVCHYCKKPGHIIRDCRKRKWEENRKKSNQKSEEADAKATGADRTLTSETARDKKGGKAKIGISIPENEPGLYVKASVEKMVVKFLIDTGATVTIISQHLYVQLGGKARFPLEELNQDILTADGTKLQIYGKTEIPISLGKQTVTHKVIVSDVTVNGIIGLDFMKTNKCLVNAWQNKLNVNGEEVPLSMEGKIGCYRIKLDQTVTVAPRTEVILPCKTEWPANWKTNDVGIVEPSEAFIESGKALVGRTIAERSDITPVRVLNPSTKSQTIHAGTTIAELRPIEKVLARTTTEQKKEDHIPTHMEELFQRSCTELTSEQTKKVKDLLVRYKDLFAESDSDFGRTGIVKHKVRTGNNAPIKQSPRRVPVHMGQEIDDHVEKMLEREVIEPSSSPWSSPVVFD